MRTVWCADTHGFEDAPRTSRFVGSTSRQSVSVNERGDTLQAGNSFSLWVYCSLWILITEEGFLVSPCCSLELCIQMGVSFRFSFAFCFSSFLGCLYGLLRQPFCLFAFLFLARVLITASYTMSRTSVHSSSGILSIRSIESIYHFHCTLIRDIVWQYINFTLWR